MTEFTFTGPNGKEFKIQGPEGATLDDAKAKFEDIKKTRPELIAGGEGGRSWAGAAGEAIGNIPQSAAKFGADIVQPFIHPIDTAASMANLGMGVMEKLGFTGTAGHEKYADAVGQFLKDRYGSMENIKKTLATDPVGMAADVSTVFTGGGGLAARAPGTLGKIGEAASAAGRAANPLSAIPTQAIGKGAAQVIGGLGTHTGAESLKTAASAGQQGGQAAQVFQENLRGAAPMRESVDEARQAVNQIRRERSAEYKAGMAGVGTDKTVLDFRQVDASLNQAAQVATYKGQQLSPSTQKIRSDMAQEIQKWKMLPPQDFHTPEGMDALKRKLGDMRDATEEHTPARVAADEIYHSVRQTIVDQVPEYAKVMKGYEEATEQLREIEKTLSLNKNATVDTALRKLQSTLRDNVNTSFGQRRELMEYLKNAGAPHLMERLAGQSLKPWLPRGLGKLQLAGNEAAAAAVGAGTMVGAKALPIAAAASPRLMGEGAYYAGKASNLPLRAGASGARALGVADDALSPGGNQ